MILKLLFNIVNLTIILFFFLQKVSALIAILIFGRYVCLYMLLFLYLLHIFLIKRFAKFLYDLFVED